MSENIWGKRLEKPILDDAAKATILEALRLTKLYQEDPHNPVLVREVNDARREANFVPPQGWYISQRLGGVASLTTIAFGAPHGQSPLGPARPKHSTLFHTQHLRAVGDRLRFTYQLPAPDDPVAIGLDLVRTDGSASSNLVQLNVSADVIEETGHGGMYQLDFISQMPSQIANILNIDPYETAHRPETV